MSAMKSSVPKSRVLRGISPTDNSFSPNPSPQRQISSRRLKSENVPPPDSNAFHEASKPPLAKARSPLPPRPPPSNSNPLKRKLSMETVPENGSLLSSDSGVQVIVRMRPKKEEEGDQIVQKISANSVSILDHVFTFDSVADMVSTQQDIFELVGMPLVENCLDGFNSSIFAYGQTGSGKTYTMWGPPNALTEDDPPSADQKGLTPRVFELLFARINEEKIKHTDKELHYQCRCSFLEIYNEQITDLLDPNRKNLQIREDIKSGVYVEALTEEYVCDMKDLMKVLIKGLANRRTGATSINAESSRSHSVFTCVVESRCKNTTGGQNSLRTSRINLVDLAGSERQKLTGAAGERLKEAGNINRSLSQLGNLINILAEVSQSGKQRHIPYRDSRLTFLLQESLGGNAKLAMICAISPAQSCKSETFSTLRFAQRAKAIKNKAVVNEEKQEDINSLREVIRQLRDELLWLKSNGYSATSTGGCTTGWNARRSLNFLKRSLNHPPMTLYHMDEDGDEVMEIDEEAVERLCIQVGLEPPVSQNSQAGSNQVPEEADVNMEDCQEEDIPSVQLHKHVLETNHGEVIVNSGAICPEHDALDNEGSSNGCETMGANASTCSKPGNEVINSIEENLIFPNDPKTDKESPSPSICSPSPNISSLSIVPHDSSLQSPTLNTSPRINSISRKSLRTSSTLSGSKKDVVGGDVLNLSFARTSKNNLPTEYLEASLHRGLQIIDSCQPSGALRRSSFRFSIKPVELKSLYPVEKVDAGVQTVSEDLPVVEEDPPAGYICSYCKNKTAQLEECQDAIDVKDLSLVPVDECQVPEKPKKHVPKAVEKVLAGAIRREMAIEEVCAKQTAEISQLNRLIQQYKHERECNAIIEQTREDKIRRLEGLMDGVLPTEEFMEEEFLSLTNEHKLLKEKYAYHPEVLRMKIELKRVQDELDTYKNYFEMGERDVLMEEIQDLRSQLQYYVDSSPLRTQRSPLLQLTYPSGPTSSPGFSTIQETPEENLEEKIEQERRHWTEIESNWISLSEELRSELEASRSLVEKQKHELDAERKCSEELKEALQLAMQGHANILDQYAELQEKHIALLARHRKIREGIADVKKAAAKAGVKGAESKFIDSLAAEISALKVEREKEWRYLRDENKGLQAQLRDTAEAVQAAGELLVRLKEAEEAVAAAQKRAATGEEEAAMAHREIDRLKKKHETEISTLNQFLAESRLPKEALRPPPAYDDTDLNLDVAAKFDDVDCPSDQRWKEEFEPFCQARGSSWFAGYDQCNM
ncbi:kinesin-like protein KIN-12B [Aristolochia californica]|uniref:kinesin-like protein KIN-12B n=1 Tax=Aristolochia californica TaxID=171875 RepID=UPI0035E10919